MTEEVTEKGAEVKIHFHKTGSGSLKLEEKEDHPRLIPINDELSTNNIPPNQSHKGLVRVVNYVYGTGDSPNHLYVKFLDSPTPTSTTETNTNRDQSVNKRSTHNNQRRTNEVDEQDDPQPLSELSGSGSRIDLKVWVASVSDHNSSKVVQTGNLADDSVEHTPPFIIFDGRDVQPLKSKELYLLRNVKDNYYEEQDKVQVVIDNYSEVVSQGKPNGAPDSITMSKSDHKTYDNLADAAADQLEAGLSPSEAPDDALSDKYRDR